MRLNKIQLNALKRLYNREKPTRLINIGGLFNGNARNDLSLRVPISFLSFRRECYPEIGARDTALIVYRGVTFGIEPDGHVHT